MKAAGQRSVPSRDSHHANVHVCLCVVNKSLLVCLCMYTYIFKGPPRHVLEADTEVHLYTRVQ